MARTVQFFDDEHSSEEDRLLMLGRSSGAKLLIVCHCEREHGEVIRIISARKATKRESAFYQGRWPVMKTEYDLSKLKSRKNPYASKLKKPVTMGVVSTDVTSPQLVRGPMGALPGGRHRVHDPELPQGARQTRPEGRVIRR
ncbi:BrnT family toxin [Rhizobacter sp. Root1221]|uniref:BrnT family toxin n=1 Tax=Rhizobacter sp. Root1221 TaxID=1736433 RepID=UPI002100C6CA|nr:BrnT family toxin [Rhizobacter sp. Root1221]